MKEHEVLKLSGKRCITVLVNTNTNNQQQNHLKLPVGLLFSSYSHIITVTWDSFSCCQEVLCYKE